MTHALHELVRDAERDQDDDKARDILYELSKEFDVTAQHISREDHMAESQELTDLERASKVLKKKLGQLSMREIIEKLDVAVTTQNPQFKEDALKEISERYPKSVDDPGLRYANIRTEQDVLKAIEIAEENGTLVSNEMAKAAATNDANSDLDFDKVIRASNWGMQEQRGVLPEKHKQGLDEARLKLDHVRHLELDRQNLKDQGVYEDAKFDDAVPYDPFADDDDEDLAA